MGTRNEGFRMDHSLSKCCKDIIRFKPVSEGYSIQVWCQKCGNYLFNGRTETLLALWLGDRESVIKNKGYLPNWLEVIDDNNR